MVKPELGSKRVCVSCSTRFYDLGRSPAICPKCGTEQPVEQPRVRRSSGGAPERPKKPVPVPGMEEAEIEVESAEEESDEEVLEDTGDLEDDSDAIGPDIEVETDTEEGER
jgi:uncharacterized protein (TIGR02300 family)